MSQPEQPHAAAPASSSAAGTASSSTSTSSSAAGTASSCDPNDVLSGCTQLIKGRTIVLRLWSAAKVGGDQHALRHHQSGAREGVHYAVAGDATLHLGSQTMHLHAGDTWVIPPGSDYTIRVNSSEPFRALEANAIASIDA